MATIHVIWTDAHDEWVDVELDNYILSAPVIRGWVTTEQHDALVEEKGAASE